MNDSAVDRLVSEWRAAVHFGLDGYRVQVEKTLASAGIVLQAKEYGVYWWRKERVK